MKDYNKILLSLLLIIAYSCDSDFDEPVDQVIVTSGSADFTKYVAIGNSLTAGFSDNALYIRGQENSYPTILSNQMQAAGGGEFSQPLMQDDIGGFADLGISGRLTLSPDLSLVSTPAATNLDNISNNGFYNNMGVPGAKSFHFGLAGYGNAANLALGAANPYYVRMASSPNSTIISDAAVQSPTFFSYWVGNNDILDYATSGGDSNNNDCVPSLTEPCSGAITNTAVYSQIVAQQLQALTANGAKGVVANLPSVTSIPFFTTVPYDALDASSNPDFAALVPAINQLTAGINQIFVALGAPERQITFNESGTTALVIHDESLTNLAPQLQQILSMNPDPSIAALAPVYAQQFGQARQATEEDLITLTSSSVIGAVNEDRAAALIMLGVPTQIASQLAINGITYPLEDQYVLLPSEQDAIDSARNSYNSALESLANQYDLAYVDMASRLVDLNTESGITYNGANYSSTFVTGGAFSLDAVHPTGRGYSIIANEFIKAINQKYGSNLREVNPNLYNGVDLP